MWSFAVFVLSAVATCVFPCASGRVLESAHSLQSSLRSESHRQAGGFTKDESCDTGGVTGDPDGGCKIGFYCEVNNALLSNECIKCGACMTTTAKSNIKSGGKNVCKLSYEGDGVDEEKSCNSKKKMCEENFRVVLTETRRGSDDSCRGTIDTTREKAHAKYERVCVAKDVAEAKLKIAQPLERDDRDYYSCVNGTVKLYPNAIGKCKCNPGFKREYPTDKMMYYQLPATSSAMHITDIYGAIQCHYGTYPVCEPKPKNE